MKKPTKLPAKAPAPVRRPAATTSAGTLGRGSFVSRPDRGTHDQREVALRQAIAVSSVERGAGALAPWAGNTGMPLRQYEDADAIVKTAETFLKFLI